MVVFSPWAFGTTQPWAVWTLNLASYTLGLLCVVKRLVAWRSGYTPDRWTGGGSRWLTAALGAITVLVLAWCLVSAVNARATFHAWEMRFEYRDGFIPWLPHSYDGPSSWFAFWEYLGLGVFFWALRDWLLGRTRHERRRSREDPDDEAGSDEGREDEEAEGATERAGQVEVPRLPQRLRRLLWVICINGALLSLEGTLQRLDGGNRLLWLIEPRLNKTSESQFGPYAYRSNAAQYLNPIWPVALGFWWALRARFRATRRSTARSGSSPHVLLIPAAALIAAAPVVSTSRGAVIVAAGCLVVVGLVFLVVGFRGHAKAGLITLALMLAAGVVGGFIGWTPLKERLEAPQYNFETGLTEPLSTFTLRCVLDLRATNIVSWYCKVGLSNNEGEMANRPREVVLALRGTAGSALTLYGAQTQEFIRKMLPAVAAMHAGQVLDLVIVKNTNVVTYVNGQVLETLDKSTPQAPWTNTFASTFLNIHSLRKPAVRLPVLGVSLFDVPLSADDVRRLPPVTDAEVTPSPANRPEAQPLPKPVLALDREVLDRPAPLIEQLSGRREIYRNAAKMAEDYVWLGSGPGTFGPLYALYRENADQRWQWRAHNDWLETRITFGRVGLGMLVVGLLIVAVRWWLPGGLPTSWPFAALVGVAMAGCLVHARFDFPFQVHSVLFLFLTLACIASISSRRA